MALGLGLGLPFTAGRVNALPPQQIAQLLTGDYRGSELWHLFCLADSRLTHKESEFLTTCSEVAWGGCEIPYLVPLASSPGGAHAIGVATPASIADAPQTAAGVFGYVGIYAPLSAYVATFSGGAEPNDGTVFATRMWYASSQINQATAPLLWPALEASDVQYKTIYRTLADGTTTDWALSFRAAGGGGFGAPNYQSSYVASSQASPAYGVVSVTIPASHNWAANNDPTYEVIAKPGDATVSGEKLLLCSPGWLESTSGIVLHMHGIGGKSVDGFLDDDVFSPSLATDYYPLHGANRLFWLDLGSNNPALNDAATHATKMAQLAARVRTGSRGAPIVVTTAYWYGGGTPSGTAPYWLTGDETMAASTPGVLLLDTYRAMPTYDAGNAAGLYGDTVHYGPTGVQYYARCIGDLIQAEATDSTSPAQFGTLFFGYDSTRMIESVGVPTGWDADPAGSFTGDLTTGTGTLAYAGDGWGIEHAPTVYRTATAGTLDLASVQDYSIAVVFSMATLADRRLLSDQLVASGTCRAWDVVLNADGSLGLYIRPTNGGTLWSTTTAAGTVQAGVRTVVQLQRIGTVMLLFVNGVQVAYGDVGAATATGGGSYGPGIGGYALGGSSSSGTYVCRALFAWKEAVNPRAIWRWAQRMFDL